jgi:hypothetical protein
MMSRCIAWCSDSGVSDTEHGEGDLLQPAKLRRACCARSTLKRPPTAADECVGSARYRQSRTFLDGLWRGTVQAYFLT